MRASNSYNELGKMDIRELIFVAYYTTKNDIKLKSVNVIFFNFCYLILTIGITLVKEKINCNIEYVLYFSYYTNCKNPFNFYNQFKTPILK